MATIIETSNGFIAGDPPETLPADSHWCEWCAGSGLEYDYDGDLTICLGCDGTCCTKCVNPDCTTFGHPAA